MSWGTYYVKTNGYAGHQSAAAASSEAADRRDMIENLWQRILILMSASPYDAKDCDGHIMRWSDYIDQEFRDIKQSMEEYYGELSFLDDIAEAYDEEFAIISYCRNGHAHIRSVKYWDKQDKKCGDCGEDIIGYCRLNVCHEG